MASTWRSSESTQGWDDRLRLADLADEPAFELEPDRWPRVADIAERAAATCCGDGEAACESKRRSAASRERGTADEGDDEVSTIAPARCSGWTFGVETVTEAVAAGWATDEGHTLLDWGRIPESWEDEGAGVPSGRDWEDAGTGFLWGHPEGCLHDYVWILVEIAAGEYSLKILGPTEPAVPADSYAGHPVITAIGISRRREDLNVYSSREERPSFQVHHLLSFERSRGWSGLVYAGQAALVLGGAANYGGCFWDSDYVTTRFTYTVRGVLSGIEGSGVVRDTFGEMADCSDYAGVVRRALSQGLRAVAQMPEVDELETHLAFEGSPEAGLPRAIYILARSNAFLREVGTWFFTECEALC